MFKGFLLLLLLAFFTACGFAEDLPEKAGKKSISLEDAINLALENNVSVKREQISLEAAARASSHSWNSILPSFSLSANDELELPDLAQGSAENVSEGFQNKLGLEGKVSVSISAAFFASIKKAKLDYEAKRISFDEALSEITGQTREMYFSLILSKQNIDFLLENLKNAGIQALQNEERYHKGLLSEMEYLSSKVSYEKLKPELKAQKLAYKKALDDFCLYIGLEEDVILEGCLEDFINSYRLYFDTAKEKILAEKIKKGAIPSVKNLKKQIEAAEKGLSVTRLASYGPSANLSYAVNPVFGGSERGRIKHSASIGISFPLENFLPFSRGADSIKAAEDYVKDLHLQLKEKKRRSDEEFSYIIQALSQKEESIDSLKAFVALTLSSYDTAKYAYSKGMTEFLSLQNASKENFEARLNLQNEFFDTLKLYISLEKLCGISAFSPVEE